MLGHFNIDIVIKQLTIRQRVQQNLKNECDYILDHFKWIYDDFKIRSHAHAVNDWVYCPELGASPRPQGGTS